MGYLTRATRDELAGLSEDSWQAVLADVAGGKSVAEVCAERTWNQGAFYLWVQEDAKRSDAFWRAKQVVANSLAEECVGIADDTDGDHRRDRLRIMTRLELAGKWDRARYGNRSIVEHTGDGAALALDAALTGMMVGMLARARDGYIPDTRIEPRYDIEDAQVIRAPETGSGMLTGQSETVPDDELI